MPSLHIHFRWKEEGRKVVHNPTGTTIGSLWLWTCRFCIHILCIFTYVPYITTVTYSMDPAFLPRLMFALWQHVFGARLADGEGSGLSVLSMVSDRCVSKWEHQLWLTQSSYYFLWMPRRGSPGSGVLQAFETGHLPHGFWKGPFPFTKPLACLEVSPVFQVPSPPGPLSLAGLAGQDVTSLF